MIAVLFAIRLFFSTGTIEFERRDRGAALFAKKIFLTTANINDRKTRDYRLIYVSSFFIVIIVSLSLRFLIGRGCMMENRERTGRGEGEEGGIQRRNSTYLFYFVVS